MKYKVAFVCIGNFCRSQIAEGFAREYGSDCWRFTVQELIQQIR
nr:hypothetical protein [Halocella sp. SP3-1]